jgi:hypothetical protein
MPLHNTASLKIINYRELQILFNMATPEAKKPLWKNGRIILKTILNDIYYEDMDCVHLVCVNTVVNHHLSQNMGIS